ncbi:ATP-grasp peptide maturase system methyltransferase [Streptomyces qinzhouensis]|uniref:Protein-L-isoaspartate O-methyltransferase n=1 Tax=Streptomyces qinzhouensis TaxID=2599401 RepID=A0A5B8IGY6_9ACTN|nr:ATP-grasp peptide maturase system methyltransferase [Streptomyces qinzhouensis]QDY77492.1 methyltransferase domain-containing protein [Streptomyces qinzhouensis]
MTDPTPAAAADGPAGRLRERLADRLTDTGMLRSAAWRTAVTDVPREIFVPAFFRWSDGPRGTVWTPVTPASEGADAWLEEVYADETLVTQLDGAVHPGEVGGPVGGNPTSSSTLPSLVVRMLEDLNPQDGQRVLEVGTGTGYSTALMCHRLGSEHVTSVEYDPTAASGARSALATAGYTPRLIHGDGLLGDEGDGPYDHLIATCSVRTVPDAWLNRVRAGGTILTTVSGWLHGSGLVRLAVEDGGRAHGRFLPGTVSFMIARPHAAPALPDVGVLLRQAAQERRARYGPEVLSDWMLQFLAQLAVPDAQYLGTSIDGGPVLDHVIDTHDGSFATLVPDGGDGAFRVRQGGPARLWDRIEASINVWSRAGSPPQTAFTLTVTPAGQFVTLDTPDGRQRWRLPA